MTPALRMACEQLQRRFIGRNKRRNDHGPEKLRFMMIHVHHIAVTFCDVL